MTTLITRLYANKTTAAKVAAALADEGFMTRDYDVIEPPSGKVTPAVKRKLHEAMADAQVFPSQAKIYGDMIANGKALVVVRPPFGGTVAAQNVVDAFKPVKSGVKNEDAFVYPATASNSIIRNRHLPSLLPGDARIFSGTLLPALTSGRPIFSGIPQIIRKTGKAGLMNSRIMGFMPLLVNYRQS